jgi:hypothetical protein
VGELIAGIALRAGLFLQPDPAPPVIANMFSAVVILAMITTVAVPVLPRQIFQGVDESQSSTDEKTNELTESGLPQENLCLTRHGKDVV